ncbi:hypothetical protein NP493_2482g00000 [Ridgeia piscesae]|uniref:Uncharacterized protein n=1 Tax=Ridgeia piscesae TaxID=27915 RepID=A0AAD9JFR0_RIDPI|nr:hypothetical protein NP493_2482g00000 [Ridgeia piscesae]
MIKQRFSSSIRNQHTTPSSWRCKNWKYSRDTQHACQKFGSDIRFQYVLERHVTYISRTAYYHIGRICRYLEQGHTKQLVHVLVTSRIVICYSLLNGLSVAVVEKLQCV